MSWNNIIPADMLLKGLADFPYRVAANPSSNWPVKKAHHYEFLRVCWKLRLVSLNTMRKVADALQERTA